jgi:hypothetical protein
MAATPAALEDACQLIQASTILLEFPQQVCVTACTLFHRFFSRRRADECSITHAAAAALFLAAKVCEVPDTSAHPAVLLHKVILAFDRSLARKLERERSGGTVATTATLPPPILARHSPEYIALRDAVVRYEKEILVALGFACDVESPHKLALAILQTGRFDERLAPRVYALANDGLRSQSLCLSFSALDVACGLVFVAARQLGIPLPGNAGEETPWYAVFGCSSAAIADVALALSKIGV